MPGALRVDINSTVANLNAQAVQDLVERFRNELADTLGVANSSVLIDTSVVAAEAVGALGNATIAADAAMAITVAAPTAVAGATSGTPTWVATGKGEIGYAITVTNSTGGAATGVTGAVTRYVAAGTLSLAFTGLTTATLYGFKVLPIFDDALGVLSTYSPLSNIVTAT